MAIVKPSDLASHLKSTPKSKTPARTSGFNRASGVAKRRLIMSIEGEEKTGKNHFGFTAPGAIKLHNIDFGIEGVIQKFQDDKQIDVADYEVMLPPGVEDTQSISEFCTPVWDEFVSNYHEGLADGRTTVVDTGTDIYDLLRLSRFGKLTQVMPHHYVQVNQEMKRIYRAAYSSDSNLIMLHRLKDEWINKVVNGKEKGDKTGRRIFAGYNNTYYETQLNCRAFKDEEGFGMTIFDCRQNPELEGMELRGEMLNFATLGTLVFPDTVPSDWE